METKRSYGKSLGGAALVGGLVGVVGEALVMLYSHTPLYEAGFATIAVGTTLGLIGAVLFACGVYTKIESLGAIGAILPFCGLAAAVAGATAAASKESGSKLKGAVASLVGLLVKVVAVGIALCCVIGAVMFFTGLGAAYTAPYAPGGVLVESVGPPYGTAAGPPNGVPVGVDLLALGWALLIGAGLCFLAQALLMVTKLPLPVFLVGLLTLGGLLTPTGVMKHLVSLGGGGLQVMIIDA
ncbi:MAG: SpoVA/SpoVAEb family sporulation membrane protein, partial [Coriobacteriales bacterium]|nr:SpoVA/SpoVAEb family sporulation membrane protein [Coriobacteriales bacterium]